MIMKMWILLMTSVLMLSCGGSSDTDQVKIDSGGVIEDVGGNVSKDTVEILRHIVAQSMNLSSEKVSIEDTVFIVDGDGIVSHNDAYLKFGAMLKGVRGQSTGVTQMMSYYKVNNKTHPVVKIWADTTTVKKIWLDALDSAVAVWNKAADSAGIKFMMLKSTTGKTTVVTASRKSSSTIATAAYPNYYGAPGNRITINTHQDNLSFDTKVHSLVHEIGHTIGFSHSDGTYGYLVEGTPVNDPHSVMRSVARRWTGFTEYDLRAIKVMYPFVKR